MAGMYVAAAMFTVYLQMQYASQDCSHSKPKREGASWVAPGRHLQPGQNAVLVEAVLAWQLHNHSVLHVVLVADGAGLARLAGRKLAAAAPRRAGARVRVWTGAGNSGAAGHVQARQRSQHVGFCGHDGRLVRLHQVRHDVVHVDRAAKGQAAKVRETPGHASRHTVYELLLLVTRRGSNKVNKSSGSGQRITVTVPGSN